jgi:hypothetical protein
MAAPTDTGLAAGPLGSRLDERGTAARAARLLALSFLFLVGAAHWAAFFKYGDMTFGSEDWPKERLYLHAFREAIRDGRLPLHVGVTPAYAEHFPQFLNTGLPEGGSSVACRFLALPETILSPQILLLGLMRPGRFLVAHVLLLYAAGFCGCLWIRRRYRLGLLPFAALFVLFNFNGYITAHLAVGHVMWGGYFLLPFFGLFILDWVEDPTTAAPGLGLALVLFAMLLQGSLHLVVWCWLFIGLVMAWNPSCRRGGAVALVFSVLLGAFRLVPAAVAYWGFKRLPFCGGYPTLTDLLAALVVIREPNYQWTGGIFGRAAWWEYDAYIGLLGLAMLAYFGVWRRFGKDPGMLPYRFAALDLPLVSMALLGVGCFYYPLFKLPLPLVNSERVTSRFIVVPLVLLLVIASIRMGRILGEGRLGGRGSVLLTLGLVETFLSLLTHSHAWSVARLEDDPAMRWTYRHGPEQAQRLELADFPYVASLSVGTVVTITALLVWIYASWSRRSRPATG